MLHITYDLSQSIYKIQYIPYYELHCHKAFTKSLSYYHAWLLMLQANNEKYAHATTPYIILFTNFTEATKRIQKNKRCTSLSVLSLLLLCRCHEVFTRYSTYLTIINLCHSIDKTPYLTIRFGCQYCKLIIKNKCMQQHCTKCSSHYSQTSLTL